MWNLSDFSFEISIYKKGDRLEVYSNPENIELNKLIKNLLRQVDVQSDGFLVSCELGGEPSVLAGDIVANSCNESERRILKQQIIDLTRYGSRQLLIKLLPMIFRCQIVPPGDDKKIQQQGRVFVQ